MTLNEAREKAISVYENANILTVEAIREGLKPLLDKTVDVKEVVHKDKRGSLKESMMDDLFFMQVAKCKRCGGILLSESSKKRGYGASCYQKEMYDRKNEARQEQEKECEPWPQQKTIFDYLK